MNDLQSITTTPTVPAAPAPAEVTGTQLSSDFEVFLQMLTAQMQYQDPLNPIDSTDYATQLATFSGVEQAVQTNDLLKTLTTQMTTGGLSDLAAWVGKEVRTSSPVQFDGTPIEVFPGPLGAADTTEIIVRDAVGTVVDRIPFAAGTQSMTWTGQKPGGDTVDPGRYTLIAVGMSNGQVAEEVAVDTYARVNEVRIENGDTMVILEGGTSVPSREVTALRSG